MKGDYYFMKFVTERLGKWIVAAIVLVVGILCIVAGAKLGGQDGKGAADALEGISKVLGIVLIIVGSLAVVLAVVVALLAKKGFAVVALPGDIFLALGISLVVHSYAAELISIIILVIPYLLICIGGVLLIDAIFNLVFAIIAKKVKGALPGIIVMIILSAVSIVIGALCVGTNPVIARNVQLIIFGIIVVLFACLLVLLTFIKLPSTIVLVKTEKTEE